MHTNQIYLDTKIVARLVKDQFPEYQEMEIKQLNTQGTTNAIFRIGVDLVAKFPLQKIDERENGKIIQKEALAIEEFSIHSDFPCSKIISLGRPSSIYPMSWMLQSWLEGDIATPNDFSSSISLAQDISALIKSLRSINVNDRIFDGQGRGGNLLDHDQWIATCLENSKKLLNTSILSSLWEKFRILPKLDNDVMSHKDLIPANILVKNNRLIGVLDCGSFGVADPALDLVSVWHLFDKERRELIKNNLDSNDLEWERGAAWAFQQAIGLVWYYEKTNPSMSELGRSTLKRILDDFKI
ncbi:phosphotransferase [Acinetobacter portensis]|uniref:phosphotransferase n=1 Tax=Acinetobacter portensis TaxID=1839785 RepID=UPI0013D480FA|nr:phosphotransferase [Acinetobacter portensis]